MPELWYIWIMNVWRVRAFFYLQFKGPKSFGALNYSYIQMNLTLRTFFSFLLLFHEFRVYPSEGWGKIAKTVSSKGFWKGYFKRFQSTLGVFLLGHGFSYMGVVLSTCFPIRGDVFDTVLISSFHLFHCYSGQVLARQTSVLCVYVWVCHCYASVCFLCSMPSDLCSSFWLAWHCHEKKCWSVVSAYLLADVWYSEFLKPKLNITNNSAHMHKIHFIVHWTSNIFATDILTLFLVWFPVCYLRV